MKTNLQTATPTLTQNRIAKWLTAAVALLTLAIGAGAFTLSYEALKQTGQTGGIPAGLGWLWPLLIDGPLIVFTLALLVSQVMRGSARLWACLVVLYTLATIGFNLVHAQPSVLGWTVAIVAPVGLLLTTEALRHLAKTIIERAAAIRTLAELSAACDHLASQRAELQAGIEAQAIQVAELKAELARLRSEKKAETYTKVSGETREQAMQILAQRSDISGAELGRLLGRSDTLALRLKRELLPQLSSHNGHRPGEVSA